jgi:hypothetical protein
MLLSMYFLGKLHDARAGFTYNCILLELEDPA